MLKKLNFKGNDDFFLNILQIVFIFSRNHHYVEGPDDYFGNYICVIISIVLINGM